MTTRTQQEHFRPGGRRRRAADLLRGKGRRRGGPTDEDWTGLALRAIEREEAADPSAAIPSRNRSSLLWAADGAAMGLLERLDRFADEKPVANGSLAESLESWLAGASDRPLDASFALECLGWCHVLSPLAELLPPGRLRQLLGTLREIAQRAEDLRVLDQPVEHQLLAGELPLTLAYAFPQIAVCRRLRTPARRALSQGVRELLDGEGLPHSKYLSILRPLLACWTRCGCLARRMTASCFDAAGRNQYDWLVRQSLRLTRRTGAQVLSDHRDGRYDRELFEAALELDDDPDDNAIARRILPGGATVRGKRDVTEDDEELPAPSVYSEWAEVAVLRTDWSTSAAQLTVAFGDRSVRMELNNGPVTIWSGACDPVIEVDGWRLKPESDWQEVCWFSDEDVDYLELEMDLSGKRRVQRQLLLARKDRFLFFADVVLGRRAGVIEYRCTLPLAEGVTFQPEKETWEGYLDSGGRLALAMPLALPEWRAEPAEGRLASSDEGLELAHRVEGRHLYAPLFVALDRRRLRHKRTWRRLTVAEERKIQPPDVAVGYRVQLGSLQWLAYRSLTAPRNRSLLGQNLATEFFMGRLDRTGEVEELLEIE